jgi:glutathione synthase/RimK-type ligase-like ATP-grasp enzyme
MRRILVTGAGGSAAANFVHSLRLADEPFFVVGVDASRYQLELADVDARYLVPRVGEPDYLAELNAVVEAEQVELVHAQPDPEVAFLAKRREEVRAATFLPATEAVELCQDKLRLASALRDAGVPVPESHEASDVHRAAEAVLASHDKAWVRARRGAGARASLPVRTSDQAVAWVRWWTEERGLAPSEFLVQEFLPGREFAFQSLWSNGELVTSAVRERVAYVFGELVPSGQTSSPSVARTVHRPEVNDLAIAAVQAVDSRPNGVFCVDCKEDTAGTPRLTEINAGRFFTTSNFLASAGLNMPYEYVRIALGEEPAALPPTDAVEEGLYWIRTIDMGYKLVREDEWTSRRANTLYAREGR